MLEVLIGILFTVNLSMTYSTDNSIKNRNVGECGDYTARVYDLAQRQIRNTEIYFGVINNPLPNGVYRVRIVPDIHNYIERRIGNFARYHDRNRIVLSSLSTRKIYELYERIGDIPTEYNDYMGAHVFPVINYEGELRVFDACSGYYDSNNRRPSVFFNGQTQVR